MKRHTRLALGVALALFLAAPTGAASSAALALGGPPRAADSALAPAPEAAEEQVPEAQVSGVSAPVEEPLVAEEPNPASAEFVAPAPAPAPKAESAASQEDASTTQVEPDAAAHDLETPSVDNVQQGSTPRLPESKGGSAQLLPPNTARYVTFRVLDHTGAPAQRTVVTIPGAGERVVNDQGEATYLSLPYGDYTFSVSPSLNSRPDLQSHTGSVIVAQEHHVFTVTLLQKAGATDIGFRGRITNAATGEPLVSGLIWVEPVDSSAPRFTASTNTDGTYWITGLESKPYKVMFDTYAYASTNQIIVPSASYPTHDVALTPNRYYARSVITDPEGYPVRGATVELLDPVTGAVVNRRTTSSAGHYDASFEVSVGSPAPGMYLVRVTPPEGTDMATTYYPGVGDAGQAMPADFSVFAPRVDLTILPTQLSAVDDSYVSPAWAVSSAGLTVSDPARGLLANDDGYKSLRVSGLQGVVNANSPDTTRNTDRGGEVTVATDGTFIYAPPVDFEGVDTFIYMLRDEGPIAVATATVRITVGDGGTPADPIVLRDDTYSTSFETLLDRTGDCDADGVGANDDGEIRDFILVDNAQHGSLDLEDKGCFTYLPDPGFSGTDSYTYTANDENGDPTDLTATVTITVLAENAPVPQNDEYQVAHNIALTVDDPAAGILANDTGDSPLTVYSVLGDPVIPGFEVFTTEGNLLQMNTDGTFTFTPEAGFSGVDSVTYTVGDEDARVSALATIRFVVAESASANGDSDGDSGNGDDTNRGDNGHSTLAATGASLQFGPTTLAVIVSAVGAILLLVRRRRNRNS